MNIRPLADKKIGKISNSIKLIDRRCSDEKCWTEITHLYTQSISSNSRIACYILCNTKLIIMNILDFIL